MEEPQVLKVNTAVDENDGSAEAGEGLSLRDAVIIANSNRKDDIIELEAGLTYELSIEGEEGAVDSESDTVGDLDIADPVGKLTIRTLGNNATIDAKGIDRVFQVNGEELILENITVTGGVAQSAGEIFTTSGINNGGGILADPLAKITLTDSNVINNQASGDGGGIHAGGDLTLTNSAVSSNNATGDGGGINNPSANVAIYSSTIDANSSGGVGGGLKDPNVVRDTTISNNKSSSLGGGIYSGERPSVIINSTVNNNEADLSGGGIAVAGNSTLFNTILPDPSNKVAIANTTITDNRTKEGGGGIAVLGSLQSETLDQSEQSETLDLTNQGDVFATNITVTKNIADSDNDGNGDGGGIFTKPLIEGDNEITKSGKIKLSNSIVADNLDTPDNNGTGEINSDIAGAAQGNAHNLIGNIAGLSPDANLGQGTDIVNPNPGLGELADHGGATQTQALLPDSPAVNAGNNEAILQESFIDVDGDGTLTTIDFNGDGNFDGAIPFDQRGGEFNRIVGENVDIGAFELDPNNNPTPEAGGSGITEEVELDLADDLPNTVYRFFNQNAGVHFYTADAIERDAVLGLDNFSFEGGSYVAADPLTGMPELMPVYRFLNEDTGVHLYTISEREREVVAELDNFSFEGEAFFAYATEVEGSIPIFRFFNTSTGAHFYTPSTTERDNVEANFPDFQSEGVAYYALPFTESV